MARTQKDAPFKILYLNSPKKKKRKVDYTWKWYLASPGWWVNLMMTKPQRRAAHLWEHEVVKSKINNIEDLDTPSVSKKPHIYFY